MAHGIYTKRDFQISEEMQWHKLTTLAKPTRESFPEIKGMPLFYGENMPANHGDNKYVVPVASDDSLPVAPPYCAGSYSLFTPREAWDWVNEVLAGTGYNIKSTGMLWNRSFWFIGVELEELKALSVGDGRESKFQFNFSGGLDRKVSPQAELSSILPVCWNTISLSRTMGEMLFGARLTSKFKTHLDAAKAEVEKSVGMAAVFKKAMDSLSTKPCKADRAKRIFAGYLTPEDDDKMSTRTKNTVETLAELHVKGLGNRGETEFDMLNSFTELLTRGTSDSKLSEGKRFVSSEFGGNADDKAGFARLLTKERMRLPAIEDRGEKLLTVSIN